MMFDVSYKTATPINPTMPTENQVPRFHPNISEVMINPIAMKPPQTRMPRKNEKSFRVIMAVAINATHPNMVTPAALSIMLPLGSLMIAMASIGTNITDHKTTIFNYYFFNRSIRPFCCNFS